MPTMKIDNYYHHDEVSLKEILMFLYRGKFFFIVFLFISALTALYYINSITPSYEAKIKYRFPSELSTSGINRHRFNDDLLIPELDQSYTSEDLYKIFHQKVFSSSFRKSVFEKYGYPARLNLSLENNSSEIFGFTNNIQRDDDSTDRYSSIYMRGSDPQILSDFLNDLAYEANESVLDDLMAIENNIVQRKIDTMNQQIQRLEEFERKKLMYRIDQLKKHSFIAKQGKMNDIKLEKVSVVFDNFSELIPDKGATFPFISSTFPVWYLFGEDFIKLEIEQLMSQNDPSTKQIIDLKVSVNSLNDFDPNIEGIEVADITWSMVNYSPISPKRNLIMIIALSLSFLFSVFIWYVIEIFRYPKATP
jgi:LPS O-antigen subunit length determinant protein (WzzB/FepE family)